MRPFLQRLTPILRLLDGNAAGGLDAAAAAWRGPLLAALIAIVAGSFSLFTLPPLDRDESRFAQATAQMLESGDMVMIQYQDQPRFKKPVGIHWLQAAAVSAVSDVDDREIWAYRLPSLLGAAIAAAALAWGAAGFYGPRVGLFAGAILAASGLLSTEASIAKTDAVLCGSVTLAMAAMARMYAAARGGPAAGRWTRFAFWAGLAVGILDKGPIAPMVVLMAGLALWGLDREAGWMGRRNLSWGWGLLLVAAVCLPWAAAITVATDGTFWSTAVGGDLAPKLKGGQEGHGAPFGYYTALAPFLIFPSALLLPAAAALAWKRRNDSGVRFALAWLVPTWLMFELLPTKLVHYTLPAYGALAWLMAAAVAGPDAPPIGKVARVLGAALSVLAAVVFAAVAIVGLKQYGDRSDAFAAVMTAVLYLAAGIAGAVLLLRGRGLRAVIVALALGVLAHGMLAGVLLPMLQPLWLSKRAADLVSEAALDPRTGLAQGPIEVAGYAEPSLVFALGTKTGLDDAAQAAEGLAQGRPAIVEKRQDAAFHAALAAQHAVARPVGSVSGVDYSNGDKMTLTVYAPAVTARPRTQKADQADTDSSIEPTAGERGSAKPDAVEPSQVRPGVRAGSRAAAGRRP